MIQSGSVKSYVLFGVGVTALWLALKPNSNKIEFYSTKLRKKFMPGKQLPNSLPPLEKAGHPDPEDIEDNKMVSEGAMYSVNYYNEVKQS
ncbi:hypothetical protein CVD25_15840 [Bacillus canaveralius]|uniref:Uncharacterized protein n=1 Tax=Bacillus canaveralius TaxID=1403243 RepID=A0A2N5GGZ4_9BACI|nr:MULTISPECIES: hypothetical protein [Bacillus]PLR80039.1 hypothetical protein CU635_19975 [Bacillus canaveralius]PLR87075.1 hypothetical protein CVD23_04445 [Bacillus sp. V33-4]PLR94931.1 hypothetical protein CVD25_15840 [Bacillus canaveralius]RSK50669.1 hypothetical protein EJA13_14385 [Bacillus canaveralius]